ncbi:hypothetical protein OEZ86_011861 [Tetradesmus obliquus]|nr:hypothetical protein OEZ86_011861 [Tetradesmus obliquus]
MNAVFDANAEFATYATDQMAAYPQSLAALKLNAFSASTRNFQCLANATLVAVLAQADGAAVQQSWPTDPATVLELYSDMLVGEMCKHLDFREEQLKQVLCGGGSADRAAAATAELLEVRSTRADIQAKEYMLPDMVGRCMAVAHQLFVVVLTPAVAGAPDGYHGFVATCHGQIFAPPGKEIDLQRAMVIPNNEVIACLNVGDHFAAVPLPVDLKLQLLPEDHHQRKDLFGSSEGRTVVAGVVARHWRAAMPACNGANQRLLKLSGCGGNTAAVDSAGLAAAASVAADARGVARVAAAGGAAGVQRQSPAGTKHSNESSGGLGVPSPGAAAAAAANTGAVAFDTGLSQGQQAAAAIFGTGSKGGKGTGVQRSACKAASSAAAGLHDAGADGPVVLLSCPASSSGTPDAPSSGNVGPPAVSLAGDATGARMGAYKAAGKERVAMHFVEMALSANKACTKAGQHNHDQPASKRVSLRRLNGKNRMHVRIDATFSDDPMQQPVFADVCVPAIFGKSDTGVSDAGKFFQLWLSRGKIPDAYLFEDGVRPAAWHDAWEPNTEQLTMWGVLARIKSCLVDHGQRMAF